MKKNSEQQDRFLEKLCECSEELSAFVERLEFEGRSWDVLTDAEIYQMEALDRRVRNINLQLDECIKETRLDDKPAVSVARGLRV